MGSVSSGRAEMQIPFTSVAALQNEFGLTVFIHVANNLTRRGVFYDRSERYVYIYVFAVFAVALVSAALAAVFGNVFAFIHKVDKAGTVPVRNEINTAALAAVAAVGSAVGNAFIPHERNRSVAAVARFYSYRFFVQKFIYEHILPVNRFYFRTRIKRLSYNRRTLANENGRRAARAI